MSSKREVTTTRRPRRTLAKKKTPKKATFKLKAKPQKPKRQKLKGSIGLYEGQGFDEVAEILRSYGVDPAEATFDRELGGYDDLDQFEVVYSYPEPEKDFQRRLARYEKRKAEWEKWFEENREQIEAELTRKRDEAEAKAKAKIERQRKILEKELRKLEKEEKRLRK